MMRVEAVGRWYESRVSHVTGASHSGAGVVDSSSDEDDCSGLGGQEDDDFTTPGDLNPLLLDPTQWKVSAITQLCIVIQ